MSIFRVALKSFSRNIDMLSPKIGFSDDITYVISSYRARMTCEPDVLGIGVILFSITEVTYSVNVLTMLVSSPICLFISLNLRSMRIRSRCLSCSFERRLLFLVAKS